MDARAAFDALVHVPRLSPAEVDAEAVARAPQEVRVPLARWRRAEQMSGSKVK
ncbi:hypothetical protein ACFPZ0_13815 [Streptomonospora nanhaiensis]|uniref:hypothetical protein n=1 Tax=Streptomonospora nanhaiensis TaxID=1323731 RepID=UPI001C3849D4|nr:hypothetical protein [Streptomonospora nanhaiensis]MBV2363142.1 hypothetical protein [Streptomonospora nanhaiensis]MBX9389240.1 hypothetical protein [Streptomonospora nanhaiensis]